MPREVTHSRVSRARRSQAGRQVRHVRHRWCFREHGLRRSQHASVRGTQGARPRPRRREGRSVEDEGGRGRGRRSAWPAGRPRERLRGSGGRLRSVAAADARRLRGGQCPDRAHRGRRAEGEPGPAHRAPLLRRGAARGGDGSHPDLAPLRARDPHGGPRRDVRARRLLHGEPRERSRDGGDEGSPARVR